MWSSRALGSALLLVIAISAGIAAQRQQVTWPPAGEVIETGPFARVTDPNDVRVPPGYRVEVVARGLSHATDVTFGPDGQMYVSEAGGHTYGTRPDKAPPPRLVRIVNGKPEPLNVPVADAARVRQAPVKQWVTIDGKQVPTDYVLPEVITSRATG